VETVKQVYKRLIKVFEVDACRGCVPEFMTYKGQTNGNGEDVGKGMESLIGAAKRHLVRNGGYKIGHRLTPRVHISGFTFYKNYEIVKVHSDLGKVSIRNDEGKIVRKSPIRFINIDI